MSKRITTPDVSRLLTDIADALNACEAAGLRIKLRHGAVITQGGFVLPTDNGPWVARSSVYTAFDINLDDDDDLDV